MEAIQLTHSRSLDMQMGSKIQHIFLPVLDMLNHSEPVETLWKYDSNRKGAYVTALTNYARGGQVFTTYGNERDTRSFFFNWGFVVEGLGMKVTVALNGKNFKFDPNDPLFDLKKQLMSFNLNGQVFNTCDD